MNTVINILICGIGGQGVVFISNLLSNTISKSGYDIKESEIHGMAKRGGQVYSQIRFGKKVFSPIIADHSLNFLLDLDGNEYINYTEKTNKSTIIIKVKNNNIQLNNLLEVDINKFMDLYNIDKKNINMFLLGILVKNINEFLKFNNLLLDNVNFPNALSKKAFEIGFNL